MNSTIKTILLTILTLSVFAVALVELSGVSRTALMNKFKGLEDGHTANELSTDDQAKRDEQVKLMPKTSMDCAETKHKFGRIKEGDKVRHTWVVKNTGSNPLMISNVQVSCGCTAPFYSKEPVMPGADAEITLEFNSAGKHDTVIKNALIIANTDNSPFSIGFEAIVEKK